MVIKTLSSTELGIENESSRDHPSGRHCCAFVRTADGKAVKVYNREDDRDRVYKNQRELSNVGLAPACDECFDVTMEDGSTKYAYVTIVAKMSVDGYKGSERLTSYGRLIGIDTVYGSDGYNLARSHLSGLLERVRRAGYDWGDCCLFNFGYINGRAVIIDTDELDDER